MSTPPEIVSHRGARFEVPENTIPAFEHAIRLGMTTVEFDVHITADGELVVIHDATVDRTTNGTGAVNELTLAELKVLDARSMHQLWSEPVGIPTFREVMLTLSEMPHMEVEIKRDTPENMQRVVDGVLATLDDLGRTEGVVLTSFKPSALEMVMTARPEQSRGLIGDWSDPAMFAHAERLQVRNACISLRTATAEIVAEAKAAGYYTVGWPCNDEDAVRKVLTFGFDAVCTDAPSVFAPLLGRRITRA
ncbi:MAG: hypothetical protein M9934_08385 [Thermomicrobiales bacterium]|nr:hypothetical protein [Thermomicrobiales bacterium]MCO5217980.1 hypothetical protein [Thermomicrobiales bacterium]MCO5228287.1 hypothetical protein [Thermomicrobiales bacterium]